MGHVVTDAELAARVAEDRAAGRTIAFANGCFDVLHVGHVRYLAGAAREADRLIVAINNDDSVRALKGEGRLVETGGFAKKDRITHRIAISSPADIDNDVKRWLRVAYEGDAE